MSSASKRSLAATFVAVAAALVGAASASAAPELSFSALERIQPVVHANDERIDYTVRIRNTGDVATSGTTTIAISPSGRAKLIWGEGSSWTCKPIASTCTTSQAIGPDGGLSNPLDVSIWVEPGSEAGETIRLTFAAFGGGASGDAIALDDVQLAAAIPFELVDFAASACTLSADVPDAGLCGSDFGSAESTEAGGHPFAATSSFAATTRNSPQGELPIGPFTGVLPTESIRGIYFELPAGFIGNLQAVPSICTFAQVDAYECPASAAVGGVDPESASGDVTAYAPLYRIVPEDGYAAAFAFTPPSVENRGLTYLLRAKLRANGDYGVTAVSPLAPQTPAIFAIRRATLCSYGAKVVSPRGGGFQGCMQPSDPGANPKPFLVNPTRCGGEAPVTTVRMDSYQHPGALSEALPDLSDPNWKSASVTNPSGNDCEALTDGWTGAKAPSFGFQPDTSRADAAAGYTANLHIPQDGIEDPDGVANSHLKDTVVRLPEGLALNPSAADGLTACSLEDVGYRGNDFPAPNRIRFTTAAPGCPSSSKVGTAVVETPVLEDSLPGAVYLAAQEANPFGSDFAIYLVVDDPKTGIKATIPGRVDTDPVTGRITSTFVDNPQAPVEDVELKFFTGSRASLANPDVCGDYPVLTELSPWSAVDPYNPTADELATPGDTVSVDAPASDGQACPATKAGRLFDIDVTAGMTDARGRSYSPFRLRMVRPGGNQEFDTVEVSNPDGLVAKLAGIPYCSEAAIQRAIDRIATGDGKLEQYNPSCSNASKVGTTTVGAGAGDSPIFVKGNVYLAGPYKGAPLSLAFIVPAVAGPFDLGVQVVRTALHVDRRSAQVTAVSDRIPQILRGVPVRVRDVRVDIDRPNFMLNPSDCSEKQVGSTIRGNSGAVDTGSNRFQARGCAALPFKPQIRMQNMDRGRKSTLRSWNPRMKFVVRQEGIGEAGISGAKVTLPSSVILDQSNLDTTCTRAQMAAEDCPAGSIVGYARAFSPLLNRPVQGPVYLAANGGVRPLPDVVAVLDGEIKVELTSWIDTVRRGGKGRLRSTFNVVPDAPVERFVLTMRGGKNRGLLVNSTDLCRTKERAVANFSGHNGKRSFSRPRIGLRFKGCKKVQRKIARRAKARQVARKQALRSIAARAGKSS